MLEPLRALRADDADPFTAEAAGSEGFLTPRPAAGAPTTAGLRFVARAAGASVGVVAFDEVEPDDETGRVAWRVDGVDGSVGGTAFADEVAVAALDHGFGALALAKLWCEVVGDGPIGPLLDLGFRVEGTFRAQVVRDGKRRDVHRLALMAKDWAVRRPDVVARIAAPDARRPALDPGARHEVLWTLGADDLLAFASLTGDTNPIHVDDEAARSLGFEGRLAHGMLVAAVFSRVFGAEFPGFGSVYVRQDVRFLAPAYPDRPLRGSVEVVRRVGRWVTLRTTVDDVDSGARLVDGEAELLVPRLKA